MYAIGTSVPANVQPFASFDPTNSREPNANNGARTIVYMRSNYHFGPQKIQQKIQMYFKRYHDITVSVSGI